VTSANTFASSTAVRPRVPPPARAAYTRGDASRGGVEVDRWAAAGAPQSGEIVAGFMVGPCHVAVYRAPDGRTICVAERAHRFGEQREREDEPEDVERSCGLHVEAAALGPEDLYAGPARSTSEISAARELHTRLYVEQGFIDVTGDVPFDDGWMDHRE